MHGGVRRSRRARRGGKEGKPLRDRWETELDLTRQHPGGVRRIQMLRAFRRSHLDALRIGCFEDWREDWEHWKDWEDQGDWVDRAGR